MARPPHLAVAVAGLAALVMPVRSLHAFDALTETVDLAALTYVSRVAWSVVAIVGFAAVGYAYASRSDDGPRRALGVAGVAAFVGVLAGSLFVAVSTGASWADGLATGLAIGGLYSVLDAAMFALLTLGGYALATDDRAPGAG